MDTIPGRGSAFKSTLKNNKAMTFSKISKPSDNVILIVTGLICLLLSFLYLYNPNLESAGS
jgi:hypothetical protein